MNQAQMPMINPMMPRNQVTLITMLTMPKVKIRVPRCGSLSRRTSVYRGLSATIQRDRWLEVPAGEQRRLAAARLLDNNSQTRLRRLDIDESALRRLDEPVRAGMTFAIPEQFAGKDRDGSFSDAEVWSHLLAYNLDYDRTVPMELHAPIDLQHRYVVRAPAGTRVGGAVRAGACRARLGASGRGRRPAPGLTRLYR